MTRSEVWRRRLSIALAAVPLAVACSTSADAAPFVYEEAIDGDLATFIAPNVDALPWFTFDLGINTISGQTAFNGPDHIPGDPDAFAFVMANGLWADSVTYSYSATLLGYTTHATLVWNIHGSLSGNTFDLSSPHEFGPMGSIGLLFPKVIWTWDIEVGGLVGQPDPGYIVDYTWTFHVSPAPVYPQPVSEPSLIVLVSMGVVAVRRFGRHGTYGGFLRSRTTRRTESSSDG